MGSFIFKCLTYLFMSFRLDNNTRKANEESMPEVDERKFIVFESQLLELFQACPVCAGPCVAEVDGLSGTLVRVLQNCTNCSFCRKWNSQPYVGQVPAGNLLLTASILLSGSLVSKVLRMLQFMGVATISRNTFNRQQMNYVCPTIITMWKDQQQQMIDTLASEEGGLILSGDGRCDSPGYCAKYGAYTVIEQRINMVLDIQLVQVGALIAISLTAFRLQTYRLFYWLC